MGKLQGSQALSADAINAIIYNMDKEDTPQLDLSSLANFDLTPAWAKKDAGVTVGKTRPERGFGDGNDNRKPADRKGPGERKPFDRKGFGDQRQGGGFGRKPFDRGERHPRFEERPKPLDAELKILPETKALGTIIRKLQQDFHAYKLKDLAYFFLDNPESILLKITTKDGSRFHQCKACGFASSKQEDVVEHIVSAHLGDYYDVKEIDCEPPKGNFSCVAKCGLSGVLLGPPNHHDFGATVKEMIRTRYPGMSEAEYRSRIEMVRDAEAIEEWRKGAVKKTVFFAKGAGEGAEPRTREQAEAEFRRNVLSSMLDEPKNLMITADQAMKSPLKPLQWAAKDALEAERRAPYNMCFALRGAFHHRKMHFFRANDARGPEFVTGLELKEFDAAHAIPELAKVANFIAENPCQPKQVIAPDAESEKQLMWLATTGHVVAFTNGVFSAVEKFPKYGPQWQKKMSKKEDAPAAPEVQAAPEVPAAPEAPAAPAAAEESAVPETTQEPEA